MELDDRTDGSGVPACNWLAAGLSWQVLAAAAVLRGRRSAKFVTEGVDMTFTQMRYFYEVCQWQNITKAAEALHVSQPTVSVAMQGLETETGLNLFHRDGKKIVMTQDGSLLLAKITPILERLAELNDEIGNMAHNRNHIRLAMPLQLGTCLLPLILADFRQVHPEIVLEIMETGGVNALHMVEDEKLDLAITNYETGFSDNLVYRKLFNCECCFCTYPEHPLAKQAAVQIEELRAEPLVLLDSTFFVHRMVLQAFARHGQKPRIFHVSPHLHTVKNLVKRRMGSTFLTRQAVLEDDHLVKIPLAKPFYINSGIVTKKGRQVYDDEKALMEFIKSDRVREELLKR